MFLWISTFYCHKKKVQGPRGEFNLLIFIGYGMDCRDVWEP